LIGQAIQTSRPFGWERGECTILHSEGRVVKGAVDSEPPYEYGVRFSYTFGGREYVSESIGAAVAATPEAGATVIRTDDWSEVEERLRKYPPGARVACFVNSKEPSQAVLERSLPWALLFLPFPGLFVLIGGGGIYLVWRRAGAAKPAPVSQAGVKGRFWHPWGKLILFSVLILVGGGVTFGFLLEPARRAASAPGWRETPCRILFSRVGRHIGDEGDTFSVDVLYEYTFNGQTRRSSRYELITASSSGYQDKKEAVERYAPGSRAVCYVNPARPEEAALNRDFPWLLLLGLIPLGMFCAGCAGMVSLARGKRAAEAVPRFQAASLRLTPSVTRPGKALGCGLMALFWNGLTGVFVVFLVKEWMAGDSPWFPTIFLIPFVLVGIGLIWGTVYYTLALFAPAVELVLTPGQIALGGSAQLEWTLGGGLGKVRNLSITLIGREEATYRRGTSTSTDKEIFHRAEILSAADPYSIARGARTVTVPAGTMHSFSAPNNKVVWLLRVQGEVASGPDIDEEYPVEVRPWSGRRGR
jgi:hypothetical protein